MDLAFGHGVPGRVEFGGVAFQRGTHCQRLFSWCLTRTAPRRFQLLRKRYSPGPVTMGGCVAGLCRRPCCLLVEARGVETSPQLRSRQCADVGAATRNCGVGQSSHRNWHHIPGMGLVGVGRDHRRADGLHHQVSVACYCHHRRTRAFFCSYVDRSRVAGQVARNRHELRFGTGSICRLWPATFDDGIG